MKEPILNQDLSHESSALDLSTALKGYIKHRGMKNSDLLNNYKKDFNVSLQNCLGSNIAIDLDEISPLNLDALSNKLETNGLTCNTLDYLIFVQRIECTARRCKQKDNEHFLKKEVKKLEKWRTFGLCLFVTLIFAPIGFILCESINNRIINLTKKSNKLHNELEAKAQSLMKKIQQMQSIYDRLNLPNNESDSRAYIKAQEDSKFRSIELEKSNEKVILTTPTKTKAFRGCST